MMQLKTFLESSRLEPGLFSCERRIRATARLLTRYPQQRSLARAVTYAFASETELELNAEPYWNVQLCHEFSGIHMDFRQGYEADAEAALDALRAIAMKFWTKLVLGKGPARTAPELLQLLATERATLQPICGRDAPSLYIGKVASIPDNAPRALVYAMAEQAEFRIPQERLWLVEPLPNFEGIRLAASDIDYEGAFAVLGLTAECMTRSAFDRSTPDKGDAKGA